MPLEFIRFAGTIAEGYYDDENLFGTQPFAIFADIFLVYIIFKQIPLFQNLLFLCTPGARCSHSF
jgi:hypothetical protein